MADQSHTPPSRRETGSQPAPASAGREPDGQDLYGNAALQEQMAGAPTDWDALLRGEAPIRTVRPAEGRVASVASAGTDAVGATRTDVGGWDRTRGFHMGRTDVRRTDGLTETSTVGVSQRRGVTTVSSGWSQMADGDTVGRSGAVSWGRSASGHGRGVHAAVKGREDLVGVGRFGASASADVTEQGFDFGLGGEVGADVGGKDAHLSVGMGGSIGSHAWYRVEHDDAGVYLVADLGASNGMETDIAAKARGLGGAMTAAAGTSGAITVRRRLDGPEAAWARRAVAMGDEEGLAEAFGPLAPALLGRVAGDVAWDLASDAMLTTLQPGESLSASGSVMGEVGAEAAAGAVIGGEVGGALTRRAEVRCVADGVLEVTVSMSSSARGGWNGGWRGAGGVRGSGVGP